MTEIPRDNSFDSTISLFFNGYNFIGRKSERIQSDIFETRLMLHKAICLRGERWAEIFYDDNKFQRIGAFPRRGLKTLVGENGVQTLDTEPHRQRKAIFMSLMTQSNLERLTDLTRLHLQNYSRKWEKMSEVVLFDEVQEILCRAVCDWAGIPLKENEVKRRTKDFEAMIRGGAKLGWQHWRGRLGRRRAENWLSEVIEGVRGRPTDEILPIHIIANSRFYNGSILDTQTAAVQLLNVLRATVAVARYVVFAAHALYKKPALIDKLLTGDEKYFYQFLQEIRRYYPFFPFVTALVKNDFYSNGYYFPKKRWVILDLYSTNHDARVWRNPHEFRPERFNEEKITDFNLIPQGGDGFYKNHRCPGEWITLALMKEAVEFLISSIEYKVPPQNLYIDLSEIPTLPESRFLINKVRFLGFLKYKSVVYA
jgi:fatty-acid peroxygenase